LFPFYFFSLSGEAKLVHIGRQVGPYDCNRLGHDDDKGDLIRYGSLPDRDDGGWVTGYGAGLMYRLARSRV
jgi:hypothetical protein